MARRSDHTREELSALILDAASKIVATEGYSALTTRRIARDIGYTSGTLYQHFADLSDIVLHVNARTMQGLIQSMSGGHEKLTRDPASRVHAYADIYLDYVTSNRNAWDAMFAWRRTGNEVVPEWYGDQIDKLVMLVASCFAEIETSHRGVAPEEAARLVWASVHGVCALESGGRLQLIMRTQIRSLVHQLVQIHIDAYCNADNN